jgi:tRNA A-37 threonylcarbamoyl transferase component Bud32
MTLREAFIKICKELDQNNVKGVTVIGAIIASEIFNQILEGVNYLHTQEPPIIHRDLKLSNILLANISKGNIVKLSDFGLSVPHDKHNSNIPQLINSRLVIKRIDSSGENLCFVRLWDDFKFSHKGYAEYKLHFYNVQLIRIHKNETEIFEQISDRKIERKIERKIIRKNIFTEEISKDLEKFSAASISQKTKDEDLDELLLLHKKIFPMMISLKILMKTFPFQHKIL